MKWLNKYQSFNSTPISKTVLLILFILPFVLLAQVNQFCKKAYLITQIVQKHHIQPVSVDDHYAEIVFQNLLENLDHDGIIFSTEDISKLEFIQHQIDDQLLVQDCNFFDQVVELYHKKILFVDSLLHAFKETKFDFSKYDTISFFKDRSYVSDYELNDKWRKLIKLYILSSYLSKNDSVQNLPHPSYDSITSIKDDIIEMESCRISSKINFTGGIEQYVGSKFLKSVAFGFDPHTLPFTPSETNVFMNDLLEESLSFGFDFSRNNRGEIEISHIIPGSPAWKSNELNIGDVILEVTTPGGNVKSFNCLSTEEVIQFFFSDEINEASFHIRKKNGKESTIKLHKENLNVAENVIRSFILQGQHKIGYINLPAFYYQVNQYSYLPDGCASDVAKELIKLKREGIEGLIFDLRSNQGGVMLEALQLAGIFINYGALGIVQSSGENPVTIKDLNRGTIYDDPMVVLLDPFSASASEFFAAALQDHHRAIIVGSISYGKSTMQEIIELNEETDNSNMEKENSANWYLKITSGEFSRVNGKSFQGIGVIPDVPLPYIFDSISLGEKSYKSSLKPSTVDKKTYYYPYDPLPINEIAHRSKQRINNDSAFCYIKQISELISHRKNEFHIPLDFNSYKAYYHSNRNLFVYDNHYIENDSVFSVENPEYLKEYLHIDDAEMEINQSKIKQINKDIYINETYNIIIDLIE